MAVVVPTNFSSIRGKEGGLVYGQANGGKIWTRQWVSPAQPATTGKTRWIAAVQAVSVIWNNATDDERQAWHNLSQGNIVRQSFGRRFANGRELWYYVSVMRQILSTLSGTIDAPTIAIPALTTRLRFNIEPSTITGVYMNVRNVTNITVTVFLQLSGSEMTPKDFNHARNRYYGNWTRLDNGNTTAIRTRRQIGVGDVQPIGWQTGITANRVYFAKLTGMTVTGPCWRTTSRQIRIISNA